MQRELFAIVTMLSPTPAALRQMHLACSQFRLTSTAQLLVRHRHRTIRARMCRNNMTYKFILPSERTDGPVTCKYYNGRWSRYYAVNGWWHGCSTQWYNDDHMAERVPYVNGKQHGEYTLWYRSGCVYKLCEYVDGVLHGWSETYNEITCTTTYKEFVDGVSVSTVHTRDC